MKWDQKTTGLNNKVNPCWHWTCWRINKRFR